jgi:hypothetical protein
MGGGSVRAGPGRGGLDRLAFGWSRFGSFPATGTATLVRSTGFGLSWPQAILLRKPPIIGVGKAWISLDSLVRIETYQWVTQLFPASLFLPAFVVVKEPSERLAPDLAWRRNGLLMGQA